MCDSIKKGMEDGTIKNDIDPYETAIFLMNCTENALDLSPEMKRNLSRRHQPYRVYGAFHEAHGVRNTE